MDDFPAISRMPGGDTSSAADFEPGELAGMRSAAWILLLSAGLALLGWIARPASSPPLSSLIDLFLGIQLLRLKHSWRSWVLLRAGLGGLLSLWVIVMAVGAPVGAVGLIMLAFGQLAYCGSLFLLLLGTPPAQRVTMGRIVFGLAIVLTISGVVLSLQSGNHGGVAREFSELTTAV
jgi:heme/copper-type cytochrome/quinol oxidase subunit 4